jgi:hypothetical protein
MAVIVVGSGVAGQGLPSEDSKVDFRWGEKIDYMSL